MDPSAPDSELINMHTAFIQSQYQSVIDFDTTPFESNDASALAARVLKLRAHLALSQSSTVLASVPASEASSTPDLAAARLLATHLGSPGPKTVAEARSLAEKHGDNLGVQILVGTLLARAGEGEAALSLLRRHQGSLDAVALVVQILLSQNRADLAAKEAKAARGWAGDTTLVNLMEAWVGMREGGDKYQQAFYVFEELAQAPSSQASRSLTAQAVSELHLGRFPEAETALKQATDEAGADADAWANRAVLATVLGSPEDEVKTAVGKVQVLDKGHVLLEEMARRKEAFDAAAAKYSPKFEP